MNKHSHEWLLSGLSGGHPLAYLASLGTLRTATLAWPEVNVTLRWVTADGTWRPILAVPGVTDQEVLLTGLDTQLKKMAGHPALAVGDDLNFKPESFRKLGVAAQEAVSTDSVTAEFLAAFACEGVLDEKGEQLADTAFRTMRGAGNQHFVKTMRELTEVTTKEQLTASLFALWRYSEIRLGLRFDPEEDRRHALCWTKPTDDPAKTERGANRLAIEAIPLFPVHPVGNRLETTGFVNRLRQGIFLSWPIWEVALSVDVVRSLLSLSVIHSDESSRQELAERGIVEIFRCQRITLGKFRNFTAAVPV